VELGPAHSLSEGFARVAILLALLIGFFATCGVGFWLGDKWFGGFRSGNRAAGIPLGVGLTLYALVAIVLVQLW
jgi:hypothetical protein